MIIPIRNFDGFLEHSEMYDIYHGISLHIRYRYGNLPCWQRTSEMRPSKFPHPLIVKYGWNILIEFDAFVLKISIATFHCQRVRI